jgi:phosphatidate cytidylyltransferase
MIKKMKQLYHNFITKNYNSNIALKNLKNRIISSLILIPTALIAIFVSNDLFVFLAVAIAVLMAFEWQEITRPSPNKIKWQIIGFAMIAIPIYCIITIHNISAKIIFWMFSVIWATDIMAFFIGKTFGGPKIAPKISPNKTISGAIGGILASIVIGIINSWFFSGDNLLFFIVASAFLSIIEQISDLLESKIKRIFGVKDSGSIIPGHGGVLDRLDGIILTAPVTLIIIILFGEKFII